MKKGYLMEAFLLGTLIFLGLTCVDVHVTVNVTDKPIISKVENAGSVKTIERGETR